MYGDKPVVLGSKALDERLVETVLGFLKELTYSGVRLTLCLSRLSASFCEWRDRRDSHPKSNDAQFQSEKRIPPFTKEQWTQMWTHFSGEDRRMLTRIVERWGSLSDELKKAVLRVVG